MAAICVVRSLAPFLPGNPTSGRLVGEDPVASILQLPMEVASISSNFLRLTSQ